MKTRRLNLLFRNAPGPRGKAWTSLVLLAVLLAAVAGPAIFLLTHQPAANPIIAENRNPGSQNWIYWHNPGVVALADDTHQQIKGYTSAVSVNKGQPITFYVSVSPAQSYSVEIYRLGWYGGSGGRLMLTIRDMGGTTQPACPADRTTGMIECRWAAAFTLNIPNTWTDGLFLAELINQNKIASYIPFTVRDDSRPAALLYQQAVLTYQAYNNYPDDGATGKSLYDNPSHGSITVAGTRRAVQVSFDRPYAGGGSGNLLNWDIYFVEWLEENGYDVTYSTDVDTHANGSRLLGVKGFISQGHDEYWSRQMVDAVQKALGAGVGLGFFGSDAMYWQVNLESGFDGTPNRAVVCYKYETPSSAGSAAATVRFRDPPLSRPEQALVGLQYSDVTRNHDYFPYVILNSSNWIYSGTGFKDGDAVPGLVGYEVDRYDTRSPLPEFLGQSYAILSASPFIDASGKTAMANSSIYQAPSGAWVFDAGTMGWSYGLTNTESSHLADSRIQRTTANVLDAFLRGHPAAAPSTTPASLLPSPIPRVIMAP